MFHVVAENDTNESPGLAASEIRNSPELTSLFNGKPKALLFGIPACQQNTDACGLPLNESTKLGKLFRDSSKF